MERDMKDDPITGSEHDFHAKNVEEWEARIFQAACKEGYFTVWERDSTVPGKGIRKEFRHFPDAAMYAHGNPRCLVYAVTKTGRSFCVVREQWLKYLQVFRHLTEEGLQVPTSDATIE
jgi:hypothetical protein